METRRARSINEHSVVLTIVFLLATLVVHQRPASAVNLSRQQLTLRVSDSDDATDQDRGFLFVNNRYVPPPYRATVSGTQISINDSLLQTDGLDLRHFCRPKPTFANASLEADCSDESFNPVALLKDCVLGSLSQGHVVVLCASHQPLFLKETGAGQELLTQLSSGQESDSAHVPALIRPQPKRESWVQLASNYRPTEQFLSRAANHLAQLEEVQTDNARSLNVNIWANRLGYPLTLFAMVAVVLGFGHLLSNKPYLDKHSENEGAARNVVGKSLAILAVLSIVDLCWTIMASQAGSMRELNPLGSRLISSPWQLAAFKITVTTIAIVVLYRLRDRRFAQAASWWSCLVLTLLTARWLTFNSMYL